MNDNEIEVVAEVLGIDDKVAETEVLDIKGKNATVRIERVITTTWDMPAEVSNVGTLQDVRLEFVIPQGMKGDTGDISPELIALGSEIRELKTATDTNVTKVKASETQCSIYATISGDSATQASNSADFAKASENKIAQYNSTINSNVTLVNSKTEEVKTNAQNVTGIYNEIIAKADEVSANTTIAENSSTIAKDSADKILTLKATVDGNSSNIATLIQQVNNLIGGNVIMDITEEEVATRIVGDSK